MKWLPILVALPGAALAFQHAASTPYKDVNYLREERIERAEECAAFYDLCDIGEMESLADELEHFQAGSEISMLKGRDHQKTRDILRSQTELKRLMQGYAVDDAHKPTTSAIYNDYIYYHW